ncbi:DUF3781 domain-containing protein [Levilactobacillus parabrevis]|uniref:DUF3781 domain-containing protein n=1 Tax=Levilactobacillus parabrevis TaxID=357278 RepID=UPI0021A2E38B|nr:DUF3781 domain-containing protein [Levilactobacillus parabrevis]MCT4488640.1 DUF3781 domain-containing protein [Levilactobacillus parabrevis]MCT4491478.1 DUF3781 domain-containing protein [Levilactobacillus parabrevis]
MRTQASRNLLDEIKKHICYTELVYQRVNKKLAVDLSKSEVEVLVLAILSDVTNDVEKLRKNYYVTNLPRLVQLEINSFNYCQLYQ